MGSSQSKVSLKNTFLNLGYPEELFIEDLKLDFSYNSLKFEVTLPLIIKEKDQVYFLVDYKPQKNLHFFERGMLALARLFFSPLPYYAIITNLEVFALIDLYEFKVIKNGKEVIPRYEDVKKHSPPPPKGFKEDLEKKILAIYLSGG